MKVSELIEKLKEMNPDSEVSFDEGGCYYDIDNASADYEYVVLSGKKVY